VVYKTGIGLQDRLVECAADLIMLSPVSKMSGNDSFSTYNSLHISNSLRPQLLSIGFGLATALLTTQALPRLHKQSMVSDRQLSPLSSPNFLEKTIASSFFLKFDSLDF
jgi:hypothetical protein